MIHEAVDELDENGGIIKIMIFTINENMVILVLVVIVMVSNVIVVNSANIPMGSMNGDFKGIGFLMDVEVVEMVFRIVIILKEVVLIKTNNEKIVVGDDVVVVGLEDIIVSIGIAIYFN